MKPLITMRDALADPAILGHAMPGPSWLGWRALLIAAMGERLTAEERSIFREITGRDQEPGERVEELAAAIGRRGGKTTAAAVLLVYLSTLVDYADVLMAGERGVALCLASNERQASIVFDRAGGIIDASPMLKPTIETRTQDSISLVNSVDLMTRPANFRGLRGITAVAIVADEIAYWLTEGANTDADILNALRPSLATTGGMLALMSSPYAERGELYTIHHEHFGAKGDPRILVAQAPSRTTNPTLPQRTVDRAMQRDPEAAKAEYLAQFRTDVSSFIDRALIVAAVDAGVIARPPVAGIEYRAFVDASSGRGDAFTAAIGHKVGERVILDCLFVKASPFDASAAVAEVSAMLKTYGISEVTGDRYSIGFLLSEFSRSNISYQPSDIDRSEIYLSALPSFTSGRVRLIENAAMVDQFAALERKTGSSGRDRVDHPRGGHDDIANAVAGVIAILAAGSAADGWLEYYRKLGEAASVVPELPPVQTQFGYTMSPASVPAAGLVRIVAPSGVKSSTFIGASGRQYVAAVIDDRWAFDMLPDDAKALCAGGVSSSLPWREANPGIVAQIGAPR